MRFILFILGLFCLKCSAITIYARTNGNWQNTTTWSTSSPTGGSCGCLPVAGDNVIIDGRNVTINSGTGNVSVNSVIIRSSSVSSDAQLTVSQGMTLTVTDDITILGNQSGTYQLLNLLDNNTRVNVGDDFIFDQNLSSSVGIELNQNSRLMVAGDLFVDKDGGDYVQISLNLSSSASSATLAVSGLCNIQVDNYDTPGITVQLAGVNCRFLINGTFLLSENTASNSTGFTYFNLYGGLMQVSGAMTITRVGNCGDIYFYLDGGMLSASSVTINSSGTLNTSTGVFFNVDGSSALTVTNNFQVNMTGGDDFYLRANAISGTSGTINIGGNFAINRNDGDDISISPRQNNSRINIAGNMSIISSATGEDAEIELRNNAKILVGGNFLYSHADGEDFDLLMLGSGATPEFSVAGNFSVITTGGSDPITMSINGGTLAIGGNCVFNQGSGNYTILLEEDARMTVGGSFTTALLGGGNMHMGIGENTSPSTAKLTVGNTFLLRNFFNSVSTTLDVAMYEMCEIETGSLTITNTYASSPVTYMSLNGTSMLDVNGDITFNAAAAAKALLQVTATASVELMGNINRAASPNKFGKIDFTGGGTIEYNGTASQIFAQQAGNGTDNINYHKVRINNTFTTSPQISMEGPVNVTTSIVFIDGVVATTSTNLLTLIDDGTVAGASDNSYVDGPFRKIGNDAFVFPVGNGDNYQAIAISAPSVTTDNFSAQYFKTNPNPLYNRASKSFVLDHVSEVEYWMLSRVTGTSNVFVTLTWDGNSGGVSNLSHLAVARWSGTQWVSHGNGATTGNTVTGTVRTSGTAGAFGPFTLASTTSLNALPIELLDFTAHESQGNSEIEWRTATEKNVRSFYVETTQDGVNWQVKDSLKAKGNSSTIIGYKLLDTHPFKPIAYYRLRSVDVDNSFSLSKIVFVDFGEQSSDPVIYPNPSDGNVYIKYGNAICENLNLFDELGRPVSFKHNQTVGYIELNLEDLAEGVYFLHISCNSKTIVKKLSIVGR